MQKTETSLKIGSMSSQNHMDHEQSKKPVFKNPGLEIGAHPMQGELKSIYTIFYTSSNIQNLDNCWIKKLG